MDIKAEILSQLTEEELIAACNDAYGEREMLLLNTVIDAKQDLEKALSTKYRFRENVEEVVKALSGALYLADCMTFIKHKKEKPNAGDDIL